MADLARLPLGQRVRYYRRRRGNRSQAAIAGLCGISERYLQQIEAGQKIPSAAVLARLAAQLGVPVAYLLTDASAATPAPVSTTPPTIVRALMGCRSSLSIEPVQPLRLRAKVERAWRIWQSSKDRFTRTASLLPELITDVEHARRVYEVSNAEAHREALRTAADLYGLLRSYCRRSGRLDLSLVVADRAVRAAEEADDPLRIATAKWNLCHVLLSHDDADAVEEAKEIAINAIGQLRQAPATTETTAVQGALELVAAVSDARRGRWWEARRRLEEHAAPLAAQVGEGNVQWTAFGPTNVELHAFSIEVLAGEAARGLHIADNIDIDRVPSRERLFTFTLELARCYSLRRDDAAVLVHLLRLEEVAPEDTARSALAHEMISELQRRARPTLRSQVDGLVERILVAPGNRR